MILAMVSGVRSFAAARAQTPVFANGVDVGGEKAR
jgi:hypothetical protein